ncbi:hypothetical protein [Allosalinactinospora lopnorensis]|uniref:hypothetical protein n=1 Tax=Allosalinactinospora lopnorensis TaxID=1352348 RepID=UPI000623F976|nr:hypothetical protein [Allosalinactinospora lopnorensis]
MHAPSQGPLWGARTALLAAACTGIAWSGHIAWGGSAVSSGSFLLATAALGLLLGPFTRSQRGFGEIFAVLAAAQCGLHIIFQFTAAPAPLTAHAGHGLLGYSPGMLAGHLWAALLAAALLAHGEAALWTLLALLGRALPRPVRAPRLVAAGPPRFAPEPPDLRPGLRILRQDRPRGPPDARPVPR